MGKHNIIPGNGSISGESKVWHRITLTFDGPQTSESGLVNPFMDYRLNVLFSHADTTYEVPGFYAADGNAAETGAAAGNKWKVHFAPDRPGTWTYTVSFRTGSEIAINPLASAGTAVSFDGATGAFYVSPSNKSAPDLRAKGRLAYVNKSYRKHLGSGEYFIMSGADSPENFLSYDDFDNTPNIDSLRKSWSPHIQDWKVGDPTWQNGKGKGIIGAINYLSSKGINGFSFLTMGHLGDDKNVYPWVNPANPLAYDVSKLEQWEIVFQHADHKGMFMHIKTTERENVDYLDGGELGPERKLYHRELIARFGHHLALNWNTGEENDQGTDRQKAYAQHLHNLDPYKHLIVMHTASSQIDTYFQPLLGSSSQLTGASINTNWANVHAITEKWVRLSQQSGKPWIVTNDEQNPPNRGTLPDDGYLGHDGTTTPTIADTRHHVLWGNLMAGGSGALYYFGYNFPESDLSLQDFRSRDNLFNHTRHALNFFRKYLPFQEMTNLDSLIGNPTHASGNYCLGKSGEIYAVYLELGGEQDFILTGDTAEYTLQWYNPRTGVGLTNGAITRIVGPDTVNLGYPPDSSANDWVALIKKAEPFVTESVPAYCITDSAIAQKIDSFYTALGLNNPYYSSPATSNECEEPDTSCSYLMVDAGPDLSLDCGDSSYTLVAQTNAGSPSFIWSALAGNIVSGSQNDSVIVNQKGTYLITVVDSTGCSVQDSVTLNSSSNLMVDAGPDKFLDCANGTATLEGSSSEEGTYSWTGPNGFGSGDTMPVVSDSGYYVLTVTSAFGCSGSDSVYVAETDSAAVADAGPDKFIDCSNPTVSLDGSQSSVGTYSWTGPNGFTSTEIQPIVSVEGKYILSVSTPQACEARDSVNVFGDFSNGFTDAGPNQIIDCNNPTVTLDGSASDPGSFNWTGPDGFTSTEVNPLVSDSGWYFLTVTAANGCEGLDSTYVSQDTLAPIADAGSDQSLDCGNGTVNLDGSNSDPGTYNWSGPNGFTASTIQAIVSDPGTYILTVIASNGCSDSDSVLVTANDSIPFVDAGADMTLDCNQNSVTLDGSGSDPGTYSWTGPNGYSNTSSIINVSEAGTYVLTVTASNACSASDSAIVNSDVSTPLADAGDDQEIICENPAVILDGSNSDPGTYTWTGPNGFISNLINPTVNLPGIYTLVVIGDNGCEATDVVEVTENLSEPLSNAGPDQVIDCASGTATLDASLSDSGTYSWTGPNGFSSTSISPIVSDSGLYVLTVTGNNGCQQSDSVQVTKDCATSCNGNAISHFYLVNSLTDLTIIDPLTDGAVIDLAITGNKLNIGAIVTECGETVESVVFNMTGPQNKNKIENKALWALFGNSGNDFYNWTPPLGSYTLTATPYSAIRGGGTAGTPLTINFTIIESTPASVTPSNNSPSTFPSGLDNQEVKSNFNTSDSPPKIVVYPNPFHKKMLSLKLSGKWESTLDIQLYTPNGQLVYREKRAFSGSIKLELFSVNLTSGNYQLKINDMTTSVRYE